jgi:chloramphenicol-sensitive protein RarD
MTRYSGIIAASCAYIIWGVLPIYWKALQAVPALEILCHRMSWSLLVTLAIILFARRAAAFRQSVANGANLLIFGSSATLLAVNWLIYIWAVNAGYILEASLGYFINPLVNVLLGMIFLRERLRPWQAVAVLVALAGVVYLTADYGRLPWIALTLALSFGTYGLLRKTAGLGSIEGLTLEMAFLFLPSLAYLLVLAGQGAGAFGNSPPSTNLLLVGAGAATAVPMLMFTYGARRVTMTTLGILQYVAPTLQFLIGVYIFGEPFDQSRLVGFIVIWIALAIYWIEGFIQYRRRISAQMTQMRAD